MSGQGANHPLLYEINARLWSKEITGKKEGSLADIPDRVLDEIAALNFDLIWLMGVWQTGDAGREVALSDPNLQKEHGPALPDLASEDVVGSPYAIQGYRVSDRLGGAAALDDLRQRLARRGMKLILDFVPNHTALDHPWIFQHPEFYIQGDKQSVQADRQSFFPTKTIQGESIIARGRDPYFPPWQDTAQLNHYHSGMRESLILALLEIAAQCDGVRCDMSMLVLQRVFASTWKQMIKPLDVGEQAQGEFWTEAISAVRARYPRFIFIAEVYWGLESELLALGFDYAYDKLLYDHLVHGSGSDVSRHLASNPNLVVRSVHFLENHDEARIAALLQRERHRAAALLCYTLPGMRLFHEGQMEGRRSRAAIQLSRRPEEKLDRETRRFYARLLAEAAGPIMQQGKWSLLSPRAASEGNPGWGNFVIYQWEGKEKAARLVVVNFGPFPAQCCVTIDLPWIGGEQIELQDLLGSASYVRDGNSLKEPGLYLDLGPFQAHLFNVIRL